MKRATKPRVSKTPSRRVHSVGIVAKTRLHAAAGVLSEIAAWLDARGVKAVFEQETAALVGLPPDRATLDRAVLPTAVDMILVLGGDGTLLAMATRIAQAGADIPILGVNFGSLGFLTEITLAELYPSLESALAGTAGIDHRRMLRSVIYRADEVLADRLVLNDVVITKSALSSIVDLSVSVGRQFVTRFRADGLIIASPTGSTAYNLSVGGPIVHPAVDALVVTPIAPHTLTHRPIVIPTSSEVRVQPYVGSTNEEIFVSFDGQFGFQLQDSDVVSVMQAAQPLQVVRAAARNYFAVLREKLKWGER